MPEYRLHFIKENRLRFLSHLELARTMERAIRRAKLPLAYSEGFHPHPKIDFGPALAVGISSEAEYFDLHLTKASDLEKLKHDLNHTLPAGLHIIHLKEIKRQHVKSLNAVLNRAAYRVSLKVEAELVGEIKEFFENLLAQTEIVVTRKVKEQQKVVNIRPWLHNVTIEMSSATTMQIELVGEIGSGGNLRAEEIVKLIPFTVEILHVVRTGLWHEEDGLVIKPLDFCE